MKEVLRIYKNNIITLIRELSDKNYQEKVWLYVQDDLGLSVSFDEAVNMLFDDSAVGYYLEKGHTLFDRNVTHALQELGHAVEAIDGFRPQKEIINDL